MDPSYYSPQPTAKVHSAAAVCYCRAHGTIAQGYHETSYPPSPITRQLIQQHPQAVVIQHGLETTLVPCQVAYHHQPVYGYMAHNTLDGANAIARQRRSQSSTCQDKCCQSQKSSSKAKSKSHRKSKNPSSSSKSNAYKSAPSSPVGTPKRLVSNMLVNHTPSTTPKKSLPLNPQWITAFPTIETPSESGYPVIKPGVTGCCGKRQMSSAVAKRRQRSNSYSALDSTSDDGQVLEEDEHAGKGAGLPKSQVKILVLILVHTLFYTAMLAANKSTYHSKASGRTEATKLGLLAAVYFSLSALPEISKGSCSLAFFSL